MSEVVNFIDIILRRPDELVYQCSICASRDSRYKHHVRTSA